MDVLLSLPIASYLLAPSTASWSTSLNLLFFYMTWTTLVLSHSPLKIRIGGSLAIRLALWLIPSLLTLLFDLGLPSLAESIKFAGRSALPERDAGRLTRQVGLAVLNLTLITAVEGGSSLAFVYIFKEPDFKTSTALPLPWQMAKHILVLFTAREVFTYYIHRNILHGKSQLAKHHARYAHARAGVPCSLQLFTDHPLALVLHRFVPIYLPALVLRPHLLTYFLFVGLCTSEETLAMSGYSIVPGIVMGGIARRCAIHYAGKGSSNYGAWGLLDWVNGTSRGGDVLEDVKAEAEKHQVKQRSAEKMDEGVGVIQSGIDALRNGNGNGYANGTRKSQRLRSKKA
ncbi:hypothetical protein B0T10DRAFT_488116 [Thelonectria olida]|uniref:Fatty acid hydroxylase domain-containing protein n=1 Tax=Thelonectria olida TaxID=1576542 RepID=A0A9P8W244_9HYPO|nr:hypothetical protein B0T10DRAFT_488116 [Thelonectria olida]